MTSKLASAQGQAQARPSASSLSVRAATNGAVEIVAVSTDPLQATVQIKGDVDLSSGEIIAVALEEVLEHGHRFVRLDLSELGFVDCAGLRVLVLAHNEFLAANGTLVLTGVNPNLAKLLRMTRLDEALFIADGLLERPRGRHLRSVPSAP